MEIIKSTYTDPRDGQTYPTVIIKSLGIEWFASNLNYDYRIGYLSDFTLDVFSIDPGCWSYENLESSRNEGLLYSFTTFDKVCPEGWQIPNRDAWELLYKDMTKKLAYERQAKDFKTVFDCLTKPLGRGGYGLLLTASGEYASPNNMYKPKSFQFHGKGSIGRYWTNRAGSLDNGGAVIMLDFEERKINESVGYGAFSIRPMRYI
jgi:uncharacterized protein (TIGR02145 family)